jgi:hypothetical protein
MSKQRLEAFSDGVIAIGGSARGYQELSSPLPSRLQPGRHGFGGIGFLLDDIRPSRLT